MLIRHLQKEDLDEADRIVRLAFGTYLGLPEPEKFMGDAGFVRSRWRTDPDAAFAAELDGSLAGSNFATTWGAFGFFGPLTIRPDLWDRGIAKLLMEPVMDLFTRRDVRHAGLFTFSQSQKHVGLYQRFGFWPRYLTAIMSKPVQEQKPFKDSWGEFSAFSDEAQRSCLDACRAITNEIYEGLDLTREIQAVFQQGLGETILTLEETRLTGFAICHFGAGTEAGSGTCYIKFGAVPPGPDSEKAFENLLVACEHLAWNRKLLRIVAGVNTARHEAYRKMLAYGFRTDLQGIAMQRPNDPGFNRPGVYLIDDWR